MIKWNIKVIPLNCFALGHYYTRLMITFDIDDDDESKSLEIKWN